MLSSYKYILTKPFKGFVIILIILIKSNTFSQNIIQNGRFEELIKKEYRIKGKTSLKNWDILCTSKHFLDDYYIDENDTEINYERRIKGIKPKSGNIYLVDYGSIFFFQNITNKIVQNKSYILNINYLINIDFKNFNTKTYNGELNIIFSENKLDNLKGIEKKNNCLIIPIKIKNLQINKWFLFKKEITFTSKYKYIYIGSLKEFNFDINDWQVYWFSYYIDDISLIPLDEIEKYNINKLKQGDKLELKNIEFEVNSASLKQNSFKSLDILANYLNSNSYNIEISGHTDNTGSFKNNLELSEARAKAVYNYLIQKGINQSRMSFIGYGSTKPVIDNKTEENKKQNRRVEIEIL